MTRQLTIAGQSLTIPALPQLVLFKPQNNARAGGKIRQCNPSQGIPSFRCTSYHTLETQEYLVRGKLSVKVSISRDGGSLCFSQSSIQSNCQHPHETRKHDASVIHTCVTIEPLVHTTQGKVETAISPEDFCCCTEKMVLYEARLAPSTFSRVNPGVTTTDIFGSRSSLNALALPNCSRLFKRTAISRTPIGSPCHC